MPRDGDSGASDLEARNHYLSIIDDAWEVYREAVEGAWAGYEEALKPVRDVYEEAQSCRRRGPRQCDRRSLGRLQAGGGERTGDNAP